MDGCYLNSTEKKSCENQIAIIFQIFVAFFTFYSKTILMLLYVWSVEKEFVVVAVSLETSKEKYYIIQYITQF